MWSGVAGPTWVSRAASGALASSRMSSPSSKRSTTRRSRPSIPRRTGATSRATRFRVSASGAATVGGPKARRSLAAARRRSSARVTRSIVAKYASLSVAPHVLSPCFSRTIARASGRARMAAQTSRDSRKPGRR